MATSSAIRDMPESTALELGEQDSGTRPSPAKQSSLMVIDKTLSAAANLSQLLPTGTVLVYQALAPSFANRGTCYTSNKYLTAALIVHGAASCAFFSLTDSLTGADGKLYYGIATLKGFYVFNYDGADEDRSKVFDDLRRYRVRPLDYVHVFFTVLLFLTVAFGDAMIQNCLFPGAGPNARELLVNLPLGAGVISTLVFLIFPTTRRGIGHSNMPQNNNNSQQQRQM